MTILAQTSVPAPQAREVADLSTAPTPAFYHLSSALAPWIILGFQIEGFGILYLSFLILAADLRFWKGLANERFSREGWWIAWSFALLTLVFSLRSANPVGYTWNMLMGVMTAYYHYRGLQRLGCYGLMVGTVAACVFAMAQCVGASIYKTEVLSPRRIIVPLTSRITFGIGGLDGYAYATSDFIPAITRVSGTATEPGFFALVLGAVTPVLLPYRWVLPLIAMGFFASFSTVTFALFVAALTLYGIYRLWRPPFALLLSLTLMTYVSAATWLSNHLGSLDAVRLRSERWFLRLWGAYGFQDLHPFYQLIGTGKNRVCDYVNPELASSSWFGNGFADFINRQSCILATQSGLGSLLVELGVIGIIVWALFFAIFEVKIRGEKLTRANVLLRTFGPNSSGVLWMWFILSLLTIHYLVYYPSHYVLAAWILWQVKRRASPSI